MAQPIVFFDIAGPEDAVLKIFYSTVLGGRLVKQDNFAFLLPLQSRVPYAKTRQRSVFTWEYQTSPFRSRSSSNLAAQSMCHDSKCLALL